MVQKHRTQLNTKCSDVETRRIQSIFSFQLSDYVSYIPKADQGGPKQHRLLSHAASSINVTELSL